MKMSPQSRLGIWAVRFTITSIVLVLIFLAFMALGLTDFDTGHWWDATLAVAVLSELAGFVLSILTIRREKTIIVWCALTFGLLAISFLLTHSLYIQD